MDEPEIAKVKLSSKIGKKAPIFTVEFSNGRVVTDSKVEYDCYKSETSESMLENNSAQRKLVANNGHLTYVGDSNDASVLRYFIGVRNKSTGKMKLYDSIHFRLKPVLDKNDIINNNAADAEKDFWRDRNRLTEEFGGKQQKRNLKARLKLDAKDDALKELLNDESISASPGPSDPFANSPVSASYLPPANKDASTPGEIFDINDIISPDIDASLHDHAISWLEAYNTNANSAKQNLCKFVLHHIENNLHDIDKLKYLLFYNYLVAFQHLTYKDVQKKDPTSLIPEPFKGNLLNSFTFVTKSVTGRASRSFPPQQKDKLVSHIIVLALLISDYCVYMPHILMDLRQVNSKKCTTIAQALGCYVTSRKTGDDNEKAIELKLPINVVLPKYRKRVF